MPSSDCSTIPFVIKSIRRLRPDSVLDVGSGFGKYGLLLREYLEAGRDRAFPTQWTVTINAVEVFKPYVDRFAWYRNVYNAVWCRDIREVAAELPPHDVVLFGDVIEHMPKPDVLKMLTVLKPKIRRAVVVCIPLGRAWLNNVVAAGNPAEKHQSAWSESDVVALFSGWRVSDRMIANAPRGGILAAVFER